jgi:hypothetical protein
MHKLEVRRIEKVGNLLFVERRIVVDLRKLSNLVLHVYLRGIDVTQVMLPVLVYLTDLMRTCLE